jgi:aryl-alcohol dehydrogenase-like predicted oxidoreductase
VEVGTGKYNAGGIPEGSRGAQCQWDLEKPEHRDKLEKVAKLLAIAEHKSITVSQLALAWLLHQGESIIPIVGAKSVKQLNENLGALDVKLTDDDLKEIDDISPSPFLDFS